MRKTYQIGTFAFQMNYPDTLVIPENFGKFEVDVEPQYYYEICVRDTLPVPKGKFLAQRPDLLVFQTAIGEERFIGVKGKEEPYAYYEEISEREARIVLIQEETEGMSIDPMFVSLLALEKRVLVQDSFVLHTAFIVHNGQAILFSAPSETGKSTQAGLWERYRGGRTVNGDRALLRKENGVWIADGWPVCGTSEVCHVEKYPIRAIVMLSQAKENQCERLQPGKSFSEVFSQITINRWNRKDTVKAMDLLEDLVQSVPVFHLGCTISEDAVKCLENALNLVD